MAGAESRADTFPDDELVERLRSTGVGFWDWNLATGAIRWSAETYNIFRRDPALGPPSYEELMAMYAPSSRPRIQAAIDAALRDGTPYDIDLELLNSDGSLRAHLARGRCIFDGAGKMVGLCGVGVDHMTARLSAAEAVARSEEMLRRITASVPGAVYRYKRWPDGSDVFLFMSDGGQRLFGVPGVEIERDRDLAWDAVIPEDLPALAASIDKSFDTGESWSHEFRIARHGSLCWVRGIARPEEREADGSVTFNGILLDITDEKEAAASRDRLETKVQKAQKLESLALLAGGVAHDFNNLLTPVLAVTRMLQTSDRLKPQEQEALGLVVSAAEQMARLTRQMFAYSGQTTFFVERLDLDQALLDLEPLLRASAGSRAMLTFTKGASPLPIAADRTQFGQVLLNLVVNAAEALDEGGGGELRVRTRVDTVTSQDNIETPWHERLAPGTYGVIEVEDTGPGMAPSVLPRVFDPFFSTKFAGRGLGLAAVLGIVRGHKGAIFVDSVVGRGTTFRVYFPSAEGAPAALQKDPLAGPPSRRARSSVLVVDDEPSVRAAVGMLIESLGYRVHLAGDRDEALAVVERFDQDLGASFVDLTMPGASGVEVAAAIKEARPGSLVFLMSGYTDAMTRRRLEGVKVEGFLEKPLELARLRQALAQVPDAQGPYAPRT